ncbi:MAG: rhomboid family intramembrane serine protease [Ignavibacteriales bacterium]|nr:MAG: rhomboid family intramembrane serine protease [Ignavibacteriales bacterium]
MKKINLNAKVIIVCIFILCCWAIKISEHYLSFSLTDYGIYPRNVNSLLGIIFTPFIHSGFSHLISNTIPLFLFGISIAYFYPRSAGWVFPIIYLVTGFLIWSFGREAYHIGASGLVYGFASFLFFSGVIRRDTRSIALALLFVFLYGGMVWGVLPADLRLSWEAHLFGGLTGFVCAFIFRKWDPQKKYDWEDEEETEGNTI